MTDRWPGSGREVRQWSGDWGLPAQGIAAAPTRGSPPACRHQRRQPQVWLIACCGPQSPWGGPSFLVVCPAGQQPLPHQSESDRAWSRHPPPGGFQHSRDRAVRPLRDLDPDQRIRPRPRVVLGQFQPKAAYLGSHRRVYFGIVTLRLAEKLRGNDHFLQRRIAVLPQVTKQRRQSMGVAQSLHLRNLRDEFERYFAGCACRQRNKH